MKQFKKLASGTAILAFWIALWYIFASAVNNSLILPTPLETAQRLFELVLTKEFCTFTAMSLLRILLGIAIAIPASFLMSAVCSYSKAARQLFEPAVLLMKSTPVVSFILIAIFIFEREIIPSAITFIMIFPVLSINSVSIIHKKMPTVKT